MTGHPVVLFVCTANQCRSPMAEALAGELAVQPGRHPGWRGVRFASVGTHALEGIPATSHARATMAGRGLDLESHGSRLATAERLTEATWMYCMEDAHLRHVLATAPELAARARRLNPLADVEDPVGQGLARYEECSLELEALLRATFDNAPPWLTE